MTRILGDRSALDAALGQARNVLLVLSGSGGTPAEAVHNAAEAQMFEPWRKTFLVENIAAVSLDESNRWFGGQAGRYAVLAVETHEVCKGGPVADLLNGGQPSGLLIDRAFSEGE